MASSKAYDLTVYGATGFTGKLCVEYLVSHPDSGSFKWAIAGRSESKLQSLKSSYKLPDSVGVFTADNSIEDDAKSGREAMVGGSKVILNLVGPYTLHGSIRLAKLCAARGTHYTDLSGESLFNAELQRDLDGVAAKSGAILAPSVGFDSIPADLTTYLGVRHLRQKAQKEGLNIKSLDARCGNAVMGGASGGTLASMNTMVSDPSKAWQMKSERPFGIIGDAQAQQSGSKVHSPTSLWLPQFKHYSGFFPLGIHNARVIYQSASHHDLSVYGKDFQFVDALVPLRKSLPSPVSFLIAAFTSVMAKFFVTLVIRFAFIRSLVARSSPAGTGPSEQARNNGFLDLRNLVVGYDAAGKPQAAALATWTAKRADPGYLMTSRLSTEVSLFLALDAAKTNVKPGARTAASLGDAGLEGLVQRLERNSKVSIGVQDWNGGLSGVRKL